MTTARLDPALTHIDESAFVAKNAEVMGDVHLAADVSVWFGAVIRGDVEEIRVGRGTNIQDLSLLHADAGYPCHIGEEVTVGHRCILHGCKIGRRTMVGMGSIIMNGALIGEECIIGAGALIPEGKEIPPRSLVLGAPGRVKREVTEAELAVLEMSFRHYVENSRSFAAAGYGRAR